MVNTAFFVDNVKNKRYNIIAIIVLKLTAVKTLNTLPKIKVKEFSK
jgi:hypothetical protein